MATVIIRTATADDWPGMWAFMQGIIAAGETYTYPRDTSQELTREMWMLPTPGHTVVAGAADGTVLGTAKMNPNHLGGASHIATASFMVDPAHAGRGVGRALGEYALDWARAEGYRMMQFNAVVETNTGAVSLWRSLGFELLGTLPGGFHHPRHGYVGLHIMHRRL
jgi:GNAT superfamily N-acetyltransferase